MIRQSEPRQNILDAATFVDRVLGSPARPVAALGVSSRSIESAQEQIRTAAKSVGFDVLFVDCARSEHSLMEAVRRRLEAIQNDRGVDSATLRLAESLERSSEDSPTLRLDGLSRLWARLNEHHPALLVVLNTAEASPSDEMALSHFATYVYSDPLAALAPEADTWTPPAGRMVFVGKQSLDLDLTPVDFGEAAAIAIRDYLGREDVVRRFLDSTDGDLSRLGELVEQLPRNASHMALFRYDALTAPQRAVVDVLAIAGQPVAPDHLHDTVALLGASEYFAKSLRLLEDQSLLHKSMGGGRIVVALDDPGFGSVLVDRLDASRLVELHRAFADAARSRDIDANVELIATHYSAAGDTELALEFGHRAVSRLRRERRYPQARRLTETLLEHAKGERRDTLELELALTLEELGEFRAALEATDRIGARDEALELRRARLLARIGEWDAAIAAYDELLESSEDAVTTREAMLGRADAAYAVGDHDDAVAGLESLVEELLATSDEPSVRDRTLLSARNTLGKIAIVRSQFADAIEHFEKNRDLAVNWGWDDEVSRAQANLGVVALQSDDHEEALDRLLEALASSATHGSLPRAYCLMNLASVYQRRDQYREALEHCLEAMRCARKVGDRTAYSVSARNLATIYQDLGAYDRATQIVDHLYLEYESDDSTLAGGWNLLVRAQLQHDTGDLEAAQASYERLRNARLGAVFGAEAAIRLAEIHHALGHDDRAAEELSAADLGERALYHGLAGALRAELLLDEDAKLALELAQTAYETLEEVGEKNEPVRARLAIASALEALGREDEARTELQRELARVRRVAGNVPDEFLRTFWAKPLHRNLVERLRELDGEVPKDCMPREPQAPAKSDEQSPEFWQWRSRYSEIVGEDTRLHQVFRLIDKVAKSNATVLAYGESGTGKELVASALHKHSDRAGKPFVKVNCAAFVENLLLSELFGHEKGAFTGASEQKQGRFERADGGTIFLDEIGDISPNTQVALLRVLQEGTFERVGGSQTIQTDVRVVCATNRDLEEMVRRGEFRLDLYYRLKGVVIEMPALRERREDIGRLANHFAATLGDVPKRFSHDALQFLASYTWPGNVRELQNFVRSILLFVDGGTIELDDILEFRDFFVSGEIDGSLPPIAFDELLDLGPLEEGELATVEEDRANYGFSDPADALAEKIVTEGRSLADIKKQLEIECIRRALIETGGNVTQAADILQMKRPRLSQIINGDEELSALKARLTG